ncbi:DUF2505 domain-containing protein [Mycobacterium celatum]|uniref:DUF2505 domain-containing protein n=2 Tax=Mycobacterium celatum TaxID=28045 RepID=UPI001EE7655F|nr:DUF2505 domain-containing protein [Mycobacterium celatum]
MSVDSPAGADEILAAFGDERYWRARLAAGDGAVTLDSLAVDPAGRVAVTVTASLVRVELPKPIARFQRGDLRMVHNEAWSRVGDQVRGEVEVTVRGLRASAFAEALLVPIRSGSRLSVAVTVAVKVPLIGGQIENLVGDQLDEGIAATLGFTSDWIAENR